MRIAVVTEVSTKEKNASVLSALENREHEVFDLGMKGVAWRLRLPTGPSTRSPSAEMAALR